MHDIPNRRVTTGLARKPQRTGAYRVPPGVIEGINAALRQQYRSYQAEPLPPMLLELAHRLEAPASERIDDRE